VGPELVHVGSVGQLAERVKVARTVPVFVTVKVVAKVWPGGTV
jgi:hypothetical protein